MTAADTDHDKAAVEERITTAAGFLKLLFGELEEGYLSLWRKEGKRSKHFALPAPSFTDLAREALARAGSTDVYFGVATRRRNLGKEKRGTVADVAAISCLWADIDIAGEAHKGSQFPATLGEAQELLDSLEFRPSLVVHSGHGLHVYWLFAAPWTLETDHERELAAATVAGWQEAIRQRAAGRGWTLDKTADLARILRLPGGLNHKTSPPRPVQVLEDTGARYSVLDFESYRGLGEETRKAPAAPVDDAIPQGQRHQALLSLAGTMRRRGMTAAEIESALLAVNMNRCRPPLPEKQVREIATSMGKYEPSAPAGAAAADKGELLPPPPPPAPETDYFFDAIFPTGHFVARYIAYAGERTDAPADFHEAAGIFLLAAATPNVRARLAPYPRGLAANLYGLLVGESTTSRKSTALAIAADVLDRAAPGVRLAQHFSPEGFIEALAGRSGQASGWLVDEFSELLDGLHHKKHLAGLRGLLLTLYAGEDYVYQRHSKRQKGGEREEDVDRIARPHLNLLGATTPAIFEALCSKDIMSGLLPRFFIIMPEGQPERRPFFEVSSGSELARNNLVAGLHGIYEWAVQEPPPKVRFEETALAALDEFARQVEAETQEVRDDARLLLQRLLPMTLKMAMLAAVGREGEVEEEGLVVTPEDAELATQLAWKWRQFALAFAARLGENEFERVAARCARLVRERGRVSRRVVAQNAHVSKRILDEVEGTLADRGVIVVVQERQGNEPVPKTFWDWAGGVYQA